MKQIIKLGLDRSLQVREEEQIDSKVGYITRKTHEAILQYIYIYIYSLSRHKQEAEMPKLGQQWPKSLPKVHEEPKFKTCSIIL